MIVSILPGSIAIDSVARVASVVGAAPWEIFMQLDALLERLAADADARLAFQASFAAAR